MLGLIEQNAFFGFGPHCVRSVRLRHTVGGAFILAGALVHSGSALAQTFSTLVTPIASPDYSRDRNVSVLEEPHPDYDAQGISTGAIVAYPSITSGIGATSNTYDNDNNKRGSVFALLQPSVLARTDWARHQITVQVTDDSRRYLNESPRNQDSWFTNVKGRLDVSSQLTLNTNLQAARFFESPFSSDASASDEVLSNYLYKYAGVDAVWSEGRIRLSGGYNRSSLNFNTLHYANGTNADQSYRNRVYNVEFFRSEYALSPSISTYGQVSFDNVAYDQVLTLGRANRDSGGQQFIAGLTFDLAGLMRGNVGVGFSHRSFNASTYPSISGFSAQAKLDFFLTPLTTLTVSGQRTLQDSSLGTASGFWDTRLQIEMDHSVRENIVVSPQVQYVKQTFVGLSQNRAYYVAGLSGQVQFNRRLGGRVNFGYAHASSYGENSAAPFTEFTGTISVQYRI